MAGNFISVDDGDQNIHGMEEIIPDCEVKDCP